MASTGDLQSPAPAATSNANQQQQHCDLFRCFCCWLRQCSPSIPRVVPGQDYHAWVPAGAAAIDDDDRPMWSVLVGCTSAALPSHNLRLHRFRVAGSGRVIGRSDDLLEPFRGVSPDDDDDGRRTSFDFAQAALAPDRRRLYIVCVHRQPAALDGSSTGQAAARLPPKVFSMSIEGDKSLSPLPPLPFSRGSGAAISAHGGRLWVPAVWSERVVDDWAFTWRLFVYRLVDGDGSWAEVNSIDFPYEPSLENPYHGGSLLQGYAVITDRFILLSFKNSSFFCFDCAT